MALIPDYSPGATPLSPEEIQELIPSHISTHKKSGIYPLFGKPLDNLFLRAQVKCQEDPISLYF